MILSRDWKLLESACQGNLQEVRHLLKKSFFHTPANIEISDENGHTPLFQAAINGYCPVLEFLIEAGANVNARNKNNAIPLHAAAIKGYLEATKVLIHHHSLINHIDNNGCTPLNSAAWAGHKEIVKYLLDSKADPNLAIRGIVPLMVALDRDQREIVDILLDAGCDVNIANAEGWTPLLSAVSKGCCALVEKMLAAGGNVNSQDQKKHTPLLIASEKNYDEIVRTLIAHGANLNDANALGNTSLINALYNRAMPLCQLMLDKGADVNIKDRIGYTVLMIAAENGLTDYVDLFIKHGAELNAQDNIGNTALFIAAASGKESAVQQLINAGTDPMVENDKGFSAVSAARVKGHERIAALIERHLQEQHSSMNQKQEENAATWKPIRIFISSTFKDMKIEREELIKHVIPRIRRTCEDRDIMIIDIDLRWGITEEEAINGNILPICFSEIDRGDPLFFVGLVGDRYGTIDFPLPEEFKERHVWMKSPDFKFKSITELEMHHAIFRTGHPNVYSFFYLRSPDFYEGMSPDEKAGYFDSLIETEVGQYGLEGASELLRIRNEQLGLLKARIQENVNIYKGEYSNSKGLHEQVFADFMNIIDRIYPRENRATYLERESARQSIYAQRHRTPRINQSQQSAIYKKNSRYFKRLDQFIESDGGMFLVHGEPGSEATDILADWAFDLAQRHPDIKIIEHWAASSSSGTDHRMIASKIISKAKAYAHLTTETPPGHEIQSLYVTLEQATAFGKYLIIIDGLDLLVNNGNGHLKDLFPNGVPDGVCVVMSTQSRTVRDSAHLDCKSILDLEPLSPEDIQDYALNYYSQYCKYLSEENLGKIAGSAQTRNPLYLKIMLEELRKFGSHEQLQIEIERLLACTTVGDLIQAILQRIRVEYVNQAESIEKVLLYILKSRAGLTDYEIIELAGRNGRELPIKYWLQFQGETQLWFFDDLGRIKFSNDLIRQGVEKYFSLSEMESKVIHQDLAEYFGQTRSNNIKTRVLEEFPWQLCRAGDYARLYDLLCDLKFFDALGSEFPSDLLFYWNELSMHGYDLEQMVDGKGLTQIDCAMLWQLGMTAMFRGQNKLAQRLLEQIINKAAPLGDQWQLVQRAKGKLAAILVDQGNFCAAEKHLEEQYEICHSHDAKDGMAESLCTRADMLWLRGKRNEAGELYKQEEKLRDPQGVQYLICKLHQARNNPVGMKDAKEYLSRLESKLISQFDPAYLCTILYYKEKLCREYGDLEQSLKFNQEGVEVCKKYGLLDDLQVFLGHQAILCKNMALNANNEEECRRLLAQALELAREQHVILEKMNNRIDMQACYGNQGIILRHLGRLAEADAMLTRQEEICLQDGYLEYLSNCYYNRANLAMDCGNIKTTCEMLQKDEAICRKLDDKKGLCMNIYKQSQMKYLMKDKKDEVIALLLQAQELASECQLSDMEKDILRTITSVRGDHSQ